MTRTETGNFVLAILAPLCSSKGIIAQGQWHIEVVDEGGGHDVGSFTALVIDHDGDIHISYNQAKDVLLYAYHGAHDKQGYKMVVDRSLGHHPAHSNACAMDRKAMGDGGRGSTCGYSVVCRSGIPTNRQPKCTPRRFLGRRTRRSEICRAG